MAVAIYALLEAELPYGQGCHITILYYCSVFLEIQIKKDTNFQKRLICYLMLCLLKEILLDITFGIKSPPPVI